VTRTSYIIVFATPFQDGFRTTGRPTMLGVVAQAVDEASATQRTANEEACGTGALRDEK
jgi:hypothetical protein